MQLQKNQDQFKAANTEVVFVTTAGQELVDSTKTELELKYPFLVDTDMAVSRAYGVDDPRTRNIIFDATVLIDAQGTIRYFFLDSTQPKVEEDLEKLKGI